MDTTADRLDRATFIAFDTETTGLHPVVAKMLEIGAVRFNFAGEEIAVFEQLIDPQTSIPPDAQRINRITVDMVRGQPTVDTVLPGFIDFLGPPDSILLAHNAPFDLEFIGVDMIRLGLPFPSHLTFDTKVLAQSLMPGFMTYSLEALAARLGVARWQEHRALTDARLTKNVFLALLTRPPGVKSVSDLARLAPPLTFERLCGSRVEPPRGFEGLTLAIEEASMIEIVYEGGTAGHEPRKVTPRALLRSRGVLYLAAYSHADAKEKIYRLDRIRRFHLAAP
jgi:DNA polymerase-3 subunit epsilon